MFCPKCGTSFEGTNLCPQCGFDINTVNQNAKPENADSVTPANTQAEKRIPSSEAKTSANPVMLVVYFGLAVVVFGMFFVAANNISSGGNEIMQIQSVGGKTLEEAYYFELGAVYAGYAMITRALGIFFASVLVWLGIKS